MTAGFVAGVPQAPARPSLVGAEAVAALTRSFEEAIRRSAEATERTYELTGRPIRVRFGAAALRDLLEPAFAHLEQAMTPPTLTIDVWDSASTGAPRPYVAAMTSKGPTPAREGELQVPGASYHYEDEMLQVLHQPAPDILSALSADAMHGWFWIADCSRLPYWDRAAPFRHLLSWWLSAHGCLHVHGGAVGTPAAGVLLVGRGGSGKSTATLSSLLEPRLRYAGDDYVALSTEPEPWVHSLYCSGKIDPDNLVRVAHLVPLVANSTRLHSEKAVVYVDGEYRDRTTAGFPLVAIVIPKLTSAGPRTLAASSAAALGALAPSTILQRRPPRPAALAELRRLTEKVPAFVLELGPDPSAIPGAILRLLDELGEQTRA